MSVAVSSMSKLRRKKCFALKKRREIKESMKETEYAVHLPQDLAVNIIIIIIIMRLPSRIT